MNQANDSYAGSPASLASGHFLTTHWSVVLAARQEPSAEAVAAFERLCKVYRRPVYVFIRRWGHQAHDAEDLTQEFLTRLITPDFLKTVDPSKGRFRSFLLGVLRNLLLNAQRDSRAQKRGGKFTFVAIDAGSAEQEYLQLRSPDLSAEQLFEKQWATSLLTEVMNRLKEEFVSEGKEAQFEAIKIFLTGDKPAASYAELATKLALTKDALKMAVCRMRKRYGKLLCAELANTVSTPEEINDELRALYAALSH